MKGEGKRGLVLSFEFWVRERFALGFLQGIASLAQLTEITKKKRGMLTGNYLQTIIRNVTGYGGTEWI